MNQNKIALIVGIIGIIVIGGLIYFWANPPSNLPNSAQSEQQTTVGNTSNTAVPVPAPTATPQPSYTPPRYYTPMTFSPAVEAQRSSYVNACTSSDEMWGRCNCGFDYLISNYGLVWLIDEEAYININGVGSRELRSASLDAIEYCSVYNN